MSNRKGKKGKKTVTEKIIIQENPEPSTLA